MPQPSDSNYAAVTRHRRPFSTAGRPAVFMDDHHHDDNDKLFPAAPPRHDDDHHEPTSYSWATDCLPDDDIPLSRHLAVVAPLLEEGELDADAIVVSPTGNSSIAGNTASERRRRDEGWADLGLDQFTASATRHNLSLSNTNRTGAASSSRPATGNAGSSSS